MAELVDALVSDASEVIHGGSSPLSHTIIYYGATRFLIIYEQNPFIRPFYL